MKRRGSSSIFDSERKIGQWGRVTIGLDIHAKAGCFFPRCFIAFDKPGNSIAGYVRKSFWVTIPHIRWAKAYRFRRFGILSLYRIQNAFFYRIGSNG